MENKTRLTIFNLQIDELERSAQEVGKKFFYYFFRLIKNASIHKIDNVVLKGSVIEFQKMLNQLLDKENEANFQYKDKTIFLNKQKINFSSKEYGYAEDIFKFFERRKIGGIKFTNALSEKQVYEFLEVFVYSGEYEFENIKKKIKEFDLPIFLEPLKGTLKEDIKINLDQRIYTYYAYTKALVLLENILKEDVKSLKFSYYIKKLSRIIQNFIDICQEDNQTFLSLSQIKIFENPWLYHSVNVSILSIAIGTKIGMEKKYLALLGEVSLFHCLKNLKSNEFKFPYSPFSYFLSRRSISLQILYHFLINYEIYIRNEEKHLFSRIIKIAHNYDLYTTSFNGKQALLGDEAIGKMLEEKKNYDETLLKIFINIMGLYPPGSLVLLNNNEKAIVLYNTGTKERLNKPIVQIISTREVKDLSEGNLKIERTLYSYNENFSFLNYFLGGKYE